MADKVYGGTPQHTGSMCGTCRLAHIVRGIADSSERVYCSARNGNSPFPMQQPIVACNIYDDKRRPNKYEMLEIAWVLLTNRAGKAIGFVSAEAEDFRKQQENQAPAKSPVGF